EGPFVGVARQGESQAVVAAQRLGGIGLAVPLEVCGRTAQYMRQHGERAGDERGVFELVAAADGKVIALLADVDAPVFQVQVERQVGVGLQKGRDGGGQ